jgi:DNA-binding MurR/RpiR family transcriptional regulator
MKNQSVIEKIKSKEFRGNHRVIANKIVTEFHKMAFLSGVEMARECSVSISAITRFAQMMGYKGFPEFKRALEEIYRDRITPYEMFEGFIKKADETSLIKLSVSQDLENITRMNGMLKKDVLDQVVELMDKAQRIHLAAIGVSEILVDIMRAFLDALDKPFNVLKDYGLTKRAEITEFTEKDLFIGFSFQRIFKEIWEMTKTLKNRNVKTIAVTDSLLNPLAIEADITLVAPVTGTTFVLSMAAPLVLVNLLTNSLAAIDKGKSLKTLEKVKNMWEKYPIFCESS